MIRIVVATDFSSRSDRALRRAVLIARQCGGALTLVHVVDDEQPPYLVDRQLSAASDLLEETATTLRNVDKIDADVVATTGDAFAGILRVEESVGADLTIVGPHRRQLLDVFVGTTAERTIRRSRRPVLMANATPSEPYRRSLLAVDLDDASRRAAEAARALGILDQTETTVLHLFDAPAAGLMKRASEPTEAIDHYMSSEQIPVRASFDSFVSECGIENARHVLRPHEGSPAAAILSEADAMAADLIIVGTNQRTGLRKLLLGSVAQEVLLDATRDVLVVPSVQTDAGRSRGSAP